MSPRRKVAERTDGKKGLWTDFVPVAFHVDYWTGWDGRMFSHVKRTPRVSVGINKKRMSVVYTRLVL